MTTRGGSERRVTAVRPTDEECAEKVDEKNWIGRRVSWSFGTVTKEERAWMEAEGAGDAMSTIGRLSSR